MGGQDGGEGRYQVWHANDIDGVELSRMEGEPYMHGYTPVASVEARGLQHAVELADRRAAASGSRSTAAGDMIVGPRGHAYRVEGLGEFSQVEAASLAFPSRAERAEPSGVASLRGKRLPSPGDIAKGRGADGPEQGSGPVRDRSRGR